MPSETVASTFPFNSAELVMPTGVVHGINLSTNSVIILDRFALPNHNEVVLATSGAGKSFYVKRDILRHYSQGVRCLLIDPEREYKPLALALGGQHINLSANTRNVINPLHIRPAPLDAAGEDGEEDD